MKYLVFLVGIVLLMPGCGRVVDWGYEVFDQGKTIPKPTKPQKFLRSTTVYDQFTTIGMFDVLWLSYEVRTAYTDMYMKRRNKDEDYRNTFLRRQLEENDHFISFYVLALHSAKLSEVNSVWSVLLDIDGTIYQPMEIKIVELDPEYQLIFNKRLSVFKESYIVTFKAYDENERPLLTKNSHIMKLIFRSLVKETYVAWDIVHLKCVIPYPQKTTTIR